MLATKKMVENGGNVSMAMRDAGYSEKTAKTPTKLTKSKGFKELIEENLPDDYLICMLKQELETSTNKKHYLEMAFKLKGKFHQTEIDKKTSGYLLFQETIEKQKANYLS